MLLLLDRYDALNRCFNIQCIIHCNPINLPLRAKSYISHDPNDAYFGAIPYTKTTWPRTSLALQDYTADKLKKTLEHALNIDHANEIEIEIGYNTRFLKRTTQRMY